MYRFGSSRQGVGEMAKKSDSELFFFFLHHDSRFFDGFSIFQVV